MRYTQDRNQPYATRKTPARAAARAPLPSTGARCPCGGGCPRCASVPVQAKLAISQPGDRHERQADRVADAITSPGAPLAPARAPEIETMRSGDATSSALAVPLDALAGEGRALPGAERRYFESHLGRDLGGVRVHTDAAAASAAQALQARAFARGADIYFGAGQYRPREAAGARLLAHELVHTIQQAGADAGTMPIMRDPPKSEDAAAKKKRDHTLNMLKMVIAGLERCTAKNAVCDRETAQPNGDVSVTGWSGQQVVESRAARDARLAQLIADLKQLDGEIATASMPTGTYDSLEYEKTPGHMSTFGGPPLDVIYFRHALKRGLAVDTIFLNDSYISEMQEKHEREKAKPRPQKPKQKPPPPKTKEEKAPPAQETEPPPTHFEERLEDMIVVPHPEEAPLVYHKLSRYADNRGYIPNVFHDERGYFYRWHEKHVYLPGYKPGVEW